MKESGFYQRIPSHVFILSTVGVVSAGASELAAVVSGAILASASVEVYQQYQARKGSERIRNKISRMWENP